MTLVATKEYTDPAQMLADYAARRARLYRPEPVVVAPAPVVEPEPVVTVETAKVETLDEFIELPNFLPVRRSELSASFKPAPRHLVIETIADHFGIGIIDIKGECRSSNIVVPRQISYWLLRDLLNMSLPQIGMFLGGRDHTSALSGIRKVQRLRNADPVFWATTEDVRHKVEERLST